MLLIGAKVRYIDIEKISKMNLVTLLEFHISDSDLLIDIDKNYNKGVVFHAPEYFLNKNGHRELLDPCSSNENIRNSSLDLIKRTIDYVEKNKKRFIGTPKIIMHPGGMSESERIIDVDKLYHNLSRFLRLIDYGYNEFLLENMPPFPWYYGGSWISNVFIDEDEIIKFCEENNFSICLDISHAGLSCNYLNKSVKDYINRLLPITRHIHIADSRGNSDEGVQIDEGELNFISIFKQLRKIENKDIGIVPEIWQGHQSEHKPFKIALDKINNYLKND